MVAMKRISKVTLAKARSSRAVRLSSATLVRAKTYWPYARPGAPGTRRRCRIQRTSPRRQGGPPTCPSHRPFRTPSLALATPRWPCPCWPSKLAVEATKSTSHGCRTVCKEMVEGTATNRPRSSESRLQERYCRPLELSPYVVLRACAGTNVQKLKRLFSFKNTYRCFDPVVESLQVVDKAGRLLTLSAKFFSVFRCRLCL